MMYRTPSPAAGRLPGGLLTDNGLARDYVFVPANGLLEMALSDLASTAVNMPDAVSLALMAALHHVAGGPPSRERVDALCVADRQFLMRQLARHLGDEGGWFNATCGACGSRFDFQLQYADLPVKEAGPGYPYAQLDWRNRQLTLRIPCGADQLALLDGADEADTVESPQARLLGALLTPASEPATFDPSLMDENERHRIDAALEQASPAVCTEVAAPCPDCGHVTPVGIDPYSVLTRPVDHLLDEVHRLAWSYHWSESDILALPRARRQQYLQMIDRQRGMQQ